MSPLIDARALSVPLRLQPLDLQVGAGECVALVGPNGAGKSTLLRALIGAVPAGGTCNLTAMPLRARPRLLAYLAQERDLVWPISVADCVALGWRANPAHRGLPAVAEHLSAVGLDGFADRPVTTLSGGEKAAVLLARTLAQDTPVILADEPAAALDPAQAMRCMALLRMRADAGCAVVATLHDLPLAARVATRLIVMADGRIRADGPVADVLSSPVIAEVFGIRMQNVTLPHGTEWVTCHV